MGHGKRTEEKFNQAARLPDSVSARTNPLFYCLHRRFRSPNKKSENYKLPFSRSSLMLKYETRFTCRPGFKLPHLHNRRNLNKHIYISTNSTNRVQVNFAFTCDGHVIDICAAPASETEMMKCLHRWEFHGHIWKLDKQNISLRLRTTRQASNHPIWRLLSSLF